jgi:hypothetical protein
MAGSEVHTEVRWSGINGSTPPTERIVLVSAEPASRRSPAIEILGIGAGLAAYLYAIGGAVAFLRYLRAGLPASQAVSLLGSRQILTTGAISIVFVGLVFVVIYLAAAQFIRFLGRIEPPTPAAPDDEEHGRGATGAERLAQALQRRVAGDSIARKIVAGVVGVALAAALVVGLPEAGLGIGVELAEIAGITGLLSGIVGLIPGGYDIVSRASTRLNEMSRRRRAAICLVPVTICGVIVTVLLPLKMPTAVARLTDGSCLTGLYLSRDGDGVHLVDGTTHQIFTVSTNVLASLTVGKSEQLSGTPINPQSCTGSVTFTPATALGAATAAVYIERVIEDRASLVSAIEKGWRIPPLVDPGELDVSQSQANPLTSASVAPATLVDLGRLHGQLLITYGSWRASDRRIPLNSIDQRRICRTIRFADLVERDLAAALPAKQRKEYTALPAPSLCSGDAG